MVVTDEDIGGVVWGGGSSRNNVSAVGKDMSKAGLTINECSEKDDRVFRELRQNISAGAGKVCIIAG